MAGDWIKVEKATPRKPEVLQIADLLGIHPDHAFGLCFRFWSWVDDQFECDKCHTKCVTNVTQERDKCHAPSVTNVTLDAVICHTGFTAALIAVGWLVVANDRIEIPHFERHLSKSAKNRAKNARRQNMSRSKRDKCHAPSVTNVTLDARQNCDGTVTREEKRRVREEENPPKAPPLVDFCGLAPADEPHFDAPEAMKPMGENGPPSDDLIEKRMNPRPVDKNAPETIVGDFVPTTGLNTASTIAELVTLWCHYCRRPGNTDRRSAPTIVELVRQGCTIEEIRQAILDPARDRTEPIWAFGDRMSAAHRAANGTAAPTVSRGGQVLDMRAEVLARIREAEAKRDDRQ